MSSLIYSLLDKNIIRNLIQIMSLVIILSCSQRKSSNEMVIDSQEYSTKWIEVADKSSNFEALMSTNYLYYLKHMSVDYDNHEDGFWESVDTIFNNDWILKRIRKGACKEVSGVGIGKGCIEEQEHTINKELGKVVNFRGRGSGYITNIEFIYDQIGRLREYKDFDKVFSLKYDDKNNLKEVLKIEVNHGIRKEIGLIRFRKRKS